MINFSKYQLGAIPRDDPMTIKLHSIMLSELPAIPDKFDIDLCPQDDKMFANDTWGDCVIAARAHMTLRFEHWEKDCYLPITDDEVLAEYWMEQGAKYVTKRHWCVTKQGWDCKPNNGLDVLTSLNYWRKGWKCAGDDYSIYAYGKMNPLNHAEVKACLYLLNGAYLTLGLPISAQSQEVWDKDDSANGVLGSWGYHQVYMPPIWDDLYYCWTWGKKQRMTPAFLEKYTCQLYGVVDNKDSGNVKNILDLDRLQTYLDNVTK